MDLSFSTEVSNDINVELAAFDEAQKVEFVLLGSDQQPVLIGVNTSDGEIVYKMPIPFSLSILHYDPTTEMLYAIGHKVHRSTYLTLPSHFLGLRTSSSAAPAN
jgi:hypothetical protein